MDNKTEKIIYAIPRVLFTAGNLIILLGKFSSWSHLLGNLFTFLHYWNTYFMVNLHLYCTLCFCSLHFFLGDKTDDHQGLLIQSPPAYLLLKFDQSLRPLDFQSKMKLQVGLLHNLFDCYNRIVHAFWLSLCGS